MEHDKWRATRTTTPSHESYDIYGVQISTVGDQDEHGGRHGAKQGRGAKPVLYGPETETGTEILIETDNCFIGFWSDGGAQPKAAVAGAKSASGRLAPASEGR